MQSRSSIRRRTTWAFLSALTLAIASLSIVAAGPAVANGTGRPAVRALTVAQEHFTVTPRPGSNEMDCNGWSKRYTSVVPRFRELCTDPHGPLTSYSYRAPNGTQRTVQYWGRFLDNGHYVGHDEPSVKFISTAPNSANTFSWFLRLPNDPAKAPTNTGSVTKYAELSPAPWFGLPLCDPASYTQKPCTPHGTPTQNPSQLNNPNSAGDAFMELQFYAPGFTPFQDNVSCSSTKWCIAITIDSVASQFGFKNLNANCPEPVNFAYLQRNGVPAGPPSPQLANGHTFTPNAQTLEINSGDVLKVAISDPLTGPSAGFTAKVTDLTTKQTGFMIASAANGFMNTNFKNCAGSPFTFHAEYAEALQQNQVPWAALEGGVLMQQEIGHNEVCTSLTHPDPFSMNGLTDASVSDTCVGGNEGGTKTVGEGSCSTVTGICQHPETEGTTGPIACPSNNFNSGALCEFADGYCIPQGTRTVILNGTAVKLTMPVNFCQANRFQNGDLDFDGISYQTTSWPNGSSSTPTSFRYAGPFDQSGHSYPQIQFETDAPGSEFQCNLNTHTHCVVPPLAAKFYPYWTQTSKAGQGIGTLFPAGACIWNFGNTITGVTTRLFGKDAQYGSPDFARFGGTSITPKPIPNPQISGGCPVLIQPKA